MKHNRLKPIFLSAGLLMAAQNIQAAKLEDIKPGFAKNVILLVTDGTPTSAITLARWVYNNGQPLNIDELATGMVRTHNADTVIADSAPAGTAMATGWKTQDKLIGMKPTAATLYGAREPKEEEKLSPAATILEAAKMTGRSVGIIATSEVTHATPADFTAHSVHRNNYSDIGEQLVYQNLNVVFGGGKSFFAPDSSDKATSKKRTDSEDMVKAIGDEGYKVVHNLDEMTKVEGDKVWGFFADKDMPYDLDRDPSKVPSLSQMTGKAIDLLSKNKDGFFLMVEGSKVDWASHGNTPVAQISDFKAFDNAVKTALDFAKNNKDTLVIAVTDHATGGLTIGNKNTSRNYPELPLEDFVTVLRKAKASEGAVAQQIIKDRAKTKEIVADKLGFEPTAEELEKIQNSEKVSAIQVILSEGIAERSNLGWTTNGHTGEDVPLYVYFSNPADVLTGTVNNSDLALYMAKAFDVDLDKSTDELFVSGSKIKAMGINTKVDDTNKFNPKFILNKGGKDYVFFENKNFYEVDGKKQNFNGVVVYTDKEFFIPKAALDQIK